MASLTEQKGLAALAFLGVAERLADTRGTVQFAGWVLSAGIVGTRGCADRSCLAELGSSELLGSSRLEAWTCKIEATPEQSRHQEPLSDRCFHRNAVETGAVAAQLAFVLLVRVRKQSARYSIEGKRLLMHSGDLLSQTPKVRATMAECAGISSPESARDQRADVIISLRAD